MDVAYSAQAIDADKTAATEMLGSAEIINLPYPTTRDIRNLLPLIPGVVQDPTGNVHVNGSASNQIFSQLDGFNVTHPVSGLFDLRVSTDALRSIEVLGSRYSAEYGKGSGGVLALATGMGDDRYRFSATNFLPAVQTRKGLAIDNWTPRATVSGPLLKKRAWFFEAGC
jgi:outer membrane receptor protein involved in Fe transport